jgi:hypothetical protein
METPLSYMLLIMEPPAQRATRTPEQGRAVYAQMIEFSQDLKTRGLLVASESLTSTRDAVRVTRKDSRTQLLDGPFSEAKEIVGGFYLLNVKTREEAVAIAATCPAAEWCTVEVRALGPCYVQ